MPFLLFLIFLLPALTLAENSPFPWTPGEQLTYLIEWGPIDAAEATFMARTEPQREGIEHFELIS